MSIIFTKEGINYNNIFIPPARAEEYMDIFERIPYLNELNMGDINVAVVKDYDDVLPTPASTAFLVGVGHTFILSLDKLKSFTTDDNIHIELGGLIVHEYTHIKQMIAGRLNTVESRDYVIWEGEKYPISHSGMAYFNSPWEKEAFDKQITYLSLVSGIGYDKFYDYFLSLCSNDSH